MIAHENCVGTRSGAANWRIGAWQVLAPGRFINPVPVLGILLEIA